MAIKSAATTPIYQHRCQGCREQTFPYGEVNVIAIRVVGDDRVKLVEVVAQEWQHEKAVGVGHANALKLGEQVRHV